MSPRRRRCRRARYRVETHASQHDRVGSWYETQRPPSLWIEAAAGSTLQTKVEPMKLLVDSHVLRQVAIVLAGLVVTGLCHADPPQPADEGATLRERGNAAVRVGHLGEAVEAWRAAWIADPGDPVLACNIGRTEFRLARYPEAASWLTRCARLTPSATTPETVEHTKQITLERLTAVSKVATLIIKAPPGTQILIDNEPARAAPLSEEVYVAPGQHRVAVHNGARVETREISTTAGKDYSMTFDFAPPPPPPSPSSSALHPLALTPAMGIFVGPRTPANLRTTPEPPAPEPAPFRWWPVVVGGVLASTGVALGVTFTVNANSASASEKEVHDSIINAGQDCGDAPVNQPPACADYVHFGGIHARNHNAAVWSFIGAGAFTVGTLGYVIFEKRRVSVRPTLSGMVWRYQW